MVTRQTPLETGSARMTQTTPGTAVGAQHRHWRRQRHRTAAATGEFGDHTTTLLPPWPGLPGLRGSWAVRARRGKRLTPIHGGPAKFYTT